MDFGVGTLVDLANTAGSLLGRVGQVLAGPFGKLDCFTFQAVGRARPQPLAKPGTTARHRLSSEDSMTSSCIWMLACL